MVPVIIILLITGSMLYIASFLFKDVYAEGKGDLPASNGKMDKLLEDRLNDARNQLDEVAEESAGHIRNQTERELEKLSNEKIMAVSEYSDHVMGEINKNHQEVMFLYSMLNDKQKELDYTVEKLNRIKQMEENEERLLDLVDNQKPAKKEQLPEHGTNLDAATVDKRKRRQAKTVKQEKKTYSNKEKIILMHQEGRTDLEIAKSLGLGIGEVRLVIEINKVP